MISELGVAGESRRRRKKGDNSRVASSSSSSTVSAFAAASPKSSQMEINATPLATTSTMTTTTATSAEPMTTSITRMNGSLNGKTGDGDYYYSDSDNDETKGHKNSSHHDEKMYNSACSMGRFFLNPGLCCYLAIRQCCFRLRQNCSVLLQHELIQKQIQLASLLLQDILERKKGGEGGFFRKKQKKWDFIDTVLVAGIVLSSAVCIYCLSPFLLFWPTNLFTTNLVYRHHHHSWIRPRTDADVNNLSILIPSWEKLYNKNNIQNSNNHNEKHRVDVGGWMFPRQFFEPTSPIDYGQPDRGDLSFVGAFGKYREIQPNDEARAAAYFETTHRDTKRMHKYNMYDEDLEDVDQKCRRANWKMTYRPNCNGIHEIEISRDFDEESAGLGDDQMFDSFYISHGYYRDVWVVDQVGLGHNAKTVIKMFRWKRDLDINSMQSCLRDAVVMERLTPSPRIIDIYAHCGTTVQVEALPYEIEEVIVPGEGYIKQEDLHDEDAVHPMNDYTATEKLEMALEMAESLADLHGFEGGVIVHDDVQLCQWLRNWDGKLKLGDFNRAEIMDFDEKEMEYCDYYNGPGFGNYRAPEEFDLDDLNEKIDVFSFGNNIYALLTGLWVFYENEDDEVVHKKLIGKETAYIDPRYKERSFAERKLVEIMEKCWIYDPSERIDMFEVVKLLREAVEENKNPHKTYKLDIA